MFGAKHSPPRKLANTASLDTFVSSDMRGGIKARFSVPMAIASPTQISVKTPGRERVERLQQFALITARGTKKLNVRHVTAAAL